MKILQNLCLLITHAIGGSPFIAAFVAGLALPREGGQLGKLGSAFVEDWGQLINLAVFFLFGVLLAMSWPDLRPVHFLYGALSLTVVRMLPVTLALLGSGMSRATVLFVAWLGPLGSDPNVFTGRALQPPGAFDSYRCSTIWIKPNRLPSGSMAVA